MTPESITARIHAILVELQAASVPDIEARLRAEGVEMIRSRLHFMMTNMCKRGRAVRLSAHRGRRGAPGQYGPGRTDDRRRKYATREEAEAARKEQQRAHGLTRRKPKRKPRPEPPTVKDRPPHQAREIATAPPKQTFPSTEAWLAANADKVQVLPLGQVSKVSRLRFDYRRSA